MRTRQVLLVVVLLMARIGLSAQTTNDSFAAASLIKGPYPPDVMGSMTQATMELGEPVHLPGVETKSLWWSWTLPHHGTIYISSVGQDIADPIVAVYRGTSVASLTLLQVATNTVRLSLYGGETLRIAAVVPSDVNGDVQLHCGYDQISTTARIVPGNLLLEPSWEGTRLNPQFWVESGSIGGQIGGPGAVDGATWPHLSQDAAIWQDIQTIPGHEYLIQFAYGIIGCCGNVGVRTWWGESDLGMVYNWIQDPYWHWAEFRVVASNTTTRVKFENIHQVAALDAFSVVDLTAPPTIVTHPKSVSSFAGGAAAFLVGASGSLPLRYQWLFNDTPLADATNTTLFLTSVSTSAGGEYRVIVTNSFGSVTSAPATLTVEVASNAVIVVQPYGDILPAGAYFDMSIVAQGPPPLTYQWFKDEAILTGATNANLTFGSVQVTNGGTYQVLVESPGGNVWSVPATLLVTVTNQGGGMIAFWNKFPFGDTNIATVYDIDGATPLAGTAFVAQLYAGPGVELLRAVGEPSPFYEGENSGIFVEQIITLANVPAGGPGFAQVRAWDRAYGASYERARAAGARFGRSTIVEVVASAPGELPARMLGLQSFSLQTGLPQFSAGEIAFVERQPGNRLLWSLQGNAGFKYLIERSSPSGGFDWRPFKVLTNDTGLVTFTDSAEASSQVVIYRSRILD